MLNFREIKNQPLIWTFGSTAMVKSLSSHTFFSMRLVPVKELVFGTLLAVAQKSS